MPPPSTETDLKRRARRRLIGAVALTLLAVIVLPLLLEDEPPPASSLAVKMAASSASAVPEETSPSGSSGPLDAPIIADATRLDAPQPAGATEPEPMQAAPSKPEPKPEPPPIPQKPEPPKPVAKPPSKPAAASREAFVVQLAALSDAGKASALRARAAKIGLPAYTDRVGSLTRVRVGPFATRDAAVDAAVKLAEHGMSGQILAK